MSSVISVNNITKTFKLYYDKSVNLKEKVLFKERNRHVIHTVLENVSFEVERGEAVGLIGENGCGKSTMLKMLSRIMYPDSGSIRIEGRVSSLIELGAGFHPDMSGRENIYTNAAIFGLSRAEIDARIDKIIQFAELGDFIDSPVRIYSSGMYMRLAFAVAVNVDADILLIDEILAVGDAAFQMKCFNKLREIKASGTTIVIVSHSLGQIEEFCDRSIWVCDGKIRMQGPTRDVHQEYNQYMMEKSIASLRREEAAREAEEAAKREAEEAARREAEEAAKQAETAASEPAPEAPAQPEAPAEEPKPATNEKGWQLQTDWEALPGAPRHFGTGKALLDNVRMFDKDGTKSTVFRSGETIRIMYDYHFYEKANQPCCGITLRRMDGIHVYGVNNELDGIKWEPAENGTITFELQSLPLLTGEYVLDVALAEKGNFDCDYFRNAVRFNVVSVTQEVGLVPLKHIWKLEP